MKWKVENGKRKVSALKEHGAKIRQKSFQRKGEGVFLLKVKSKERGVLGVVVEVLIFFFF